MLHLREVPSNTSNIAGVKMEGMALYLKGNLSSLCDSPRCAIAELCLFYKSHTY